MSKKEIESNIKRETNQAMASVRHIARFGSIASNQYVIDKLNEVRAETDQLIASLTDNITMAVPVFTSEDAAEQNHLSAVWGDGALVVDTPGG